MLPVNFFSELWVYAHTKEYREGLFVEASGLVLDVLLLIVGVKLISYYLVRQSRRTTSFASSFFIVQFLREVLVLQLKSGGVAEINASLRVAFERRELESLFSHFLYGNTENLMDLLRLRMRSGEHIAGHISLTPDQRNDLSKEVQALLGRLDNLLVILASLRQEDQCLRAYEFRMVLTVVSDYLTDISNSDQAPPPRTYAPISTALASTVESWFQSCKKVLDHRYKEEIRWSYVHLVLSLPWVASYRFVVRRWRRLRDQLYKDPFSSNFSQIFCNSLAQELGNKWGEVVAASGVEQNDLKTLTTQHRAISQDECIELLEKLRPHVPAPLWNLVLATSLTTDVDSIPLSAVTVDAEKAHALYYLTKLSVKDDSSSNMLAQTLHSLWNLRPTSR